MVQKTDFIWFDGEFVPWDQAKTHVLSHALHYGTGAFEGIRAYRCIDGTSAIFRLSDHVTRLFDSIKILGLTIPHSEGDLIKAIIDTLKINKLAEGYIRPLSFVGEGIMGVHPGDNPIKTIIAVWPWGAYLGVEGLKNGIRVKTSSFVRHHVNAMMTKAKLSGNYINSVLAKMEVKSDGYDEALMLDSTGFVSEASGENIFIVHNEVIKTTPLTSILGGITRDSIINVSQELGYKVIEQQFTRDELYTADEAFFTGTAAEITPIQSVDNRIIGTGKMGSITSAIQKKYFSIVKGEESSYKNWLTSFSV